MKRFITLTLLASLSMGSSVSYAQNVKELDEEVLPWLQDQPQQYYDRETVPQSAFLETVSFSDHTQEKLSMGHRATLDAVVVRFREEPELRISLRSFATQPEGAVENEARRISLKRALNVRHYLTNNGVPSDRVIIRALGDTSEKDDKNRIDIWKL